MSNRTSDASAHMAPTLPRWRATPLAANYCLWAVLVLANAIDIFASRYAFSLGIPELNPLAALVLAEYGLVGLGAVKAVLLAALLVLLPRVTGWLLSLLVLTCLVYVAVVAYHAVYLSVIV